MGAPLEVGAQQAQLVLSGKSLFTPVATADPELADYFQAVLHEASGFEPGEPEIVESVRREVRARLIHGPPSAGAIARSLGLGHRTLQRRLGEHGHTFALLLEDTRRRMAEHLLAENQLSLAEVAYVLGYAEQSSFHRAFRRWHATTPMAYREARLGR